MHSIWEAWPAHMPRYSADHQAIHLVSAPSSNPTFELGLALAGGVSCGAYTAGAVDFLVEALDAWHAARARGDGDAPDHEVNITVVGGASSGALTAAVLAAVLPFELAPVRATTDPVEAARNPLYDSWVNMTGLDDLLGVGDARIPGVRSLMDPTPVERAARKAVEHGLRRREPRRWLGEPTRLLLSVADLQGLRFRASPVGAQAQAMVTEHAAILRFAVCGAGAVPAAPVREDERVIDHGPEQQDVGGRWAAWGENLASVALASGAVPGALPPRRLTRPWTSFGRQDLVLSSCRDAPARVIALDPLEPGSATGLQQFDAVDGGLVDNTALHAVRAELNDRDVLACNPRDGSAVQRAVLLIDPLLDSAALRAPHDDPPRGVAAQLAALGRMLVDQVRVDRDDLALALDETVYSRFLVSPGREFVNQGNCADLAGASLGGFGGYLSLEFRRHDFLLGRRNAQQALATHLTLPERHPLFARWTPAQRLRYAVGERRELPIVPLVDRLHPGHGQVEAIADWPALRVDPAKFAGPIDRRLQALYCAVPSLGLRLFAFLPWRFLLRPRLRRAVVRALGAGLRQHRLQ